MFFIIVITIIGLCLAIKMYLKHNVVIYTGKEKLNGKTVLVTGANSGIGFLCAKDFAKRGAKVLMICRNLITGEDARNKIIMETGNNNIKLKHIDFASFKNVRKCAEEILKEEKYIHILLNNAGYITDEIKLTEDNLDVTMQINYFGQFLFTNILLGKIKKSSPSRIVNVSSLAHKLVDLDLNHLRRLNTTIKFLCYSKSKLALNCFSNELARLLKDTGVSVNVLHPGVFSSEILRYQSFFFKTIWNSILIFLSNTLEEAAQTSIYLCVSSEIQNVTGKYFEYCKISTPSRVSQNVEFTKKLWKLTEEIVDLKPEEKNY